MHLNRILHPHCGSAWCNIVEPPVAQAETIAHPSFDFSLEMQFEVEMASMGQYLGESEVT
jgi:hypothetical protein